MGPAILSLIGSLAGTAASTATGIMTNNQNAYQSERARQWQQMMTLQQQRWSELQAEKADLRTRNLYNDLQSPEALKEQLKNAGLSVGMIYGQGGVGGSMSSGAMGTTPSVPSTNVATMTNPLGIEAAALIAQLAKTQAETEKIKSETELNEKEIPIKEQTVKLLEEQTENAKQTTESIKQSIKNQIAEEQKTIADTEQSKAQAKLILAQEKFVRSQDDLMQIDIQTRGQLNWAQIYKAEAEIENLYENAKKAKIDHEILEKSADAIFRKYLADAVRAEFINEKLNDKELELLNQQIKELDLKNKTEEEIRKSLENLAGGVGQAKGMKTIIELLLTIVKIIKTK